MFLDSVSNISRTFQYDYIYIDAIFLLIWIGALVWKKKYKALLFGAIIAPIIYFIDAYIWWNGFAGSSFPVGTHIREYWIGGIQAPHPLSGFFWRKFGADFMMTISYALYAFPWLWIAFEALRAKRTKEILKYTIIWICFWLLVPLLSILLNIDNTIVQTVRHMQSQIPFWIFNLLVSYGILIIIYRKNFSLVAKLFVLGVVGSLVMELPLFIFHIRPLNFNVLIFDGLFLLNQGVAWLFIIYDKALNRKSNLISK